MNELKQNFVIALIRFILVLPIAIFCWILCPLFILLGTEKTWDKMTDLFNGLVFNYEETNSNF